MLGAMDAAQAIADLKEISPQVRDVVVIGADATPIASSLAEQPAASRLANGARRLLDEAESLRPGVTQLEAATTTGSVFVVRDGERVIAATTTAEPTVGLVFYDLKTCLRSIDEAEPPAQPAQPKQPARRRAASSKSTAKKQEGDDAAT
jgi:predicted regulator of Ras-like GTPase activity (Roadblock/LC7/MglB family)